MLENNKNKIVSMLDGRKREGEHLVSLPPRQKKNKNIRAEGFSILFFPAFGSPKISTLFLSLLFVCLFVYFFLLVLLLLLKKSLRLSDLDCPIR